jgi:TonB family protein
MRYISTTLFRALVAGLALGCSAAPPASVAPACPALRTATADRADTAVYDSLSVHVPPRRVHIQPPEYPRHLLDAGVQGEVVLGFVVAPNGKVERPSIRVVRQTHGAFATAMIKVLRTATFCPGVLAGRPVRVRLEYPFRFAIPNRPYSQPPNTIKKRPVKRR